jgi:hypothetical protein
MEPSPPPFGSWKSRGTPFTHTRNNGGFEAWVSAKSTTSRQGPEGAVPPTQIQSGEPTCDCHPSVLNPPIRPRCRAAHGPVLLLIGLADEKEIVRVAVQTRKSMKFVGASANSATLLSAWPIARPSLIVRHEQAQTCRGDGINTRGTTATANAKAHGIAGKSRQPCPT